MQYSALFFKKKIFCLWSLAHVFIRRLLVDHLMSSVIRYFGGNIVASLSKYNKWHNVISCNYRYRTLMTEGKSCTDLIQTKIFALISRSAVIQKLSVLRKHSRLLCRPLLPRKADIHPPTLLRPPYKTGGYCTTWSQYKYPID